VRYREVVRINWNKRFAMRLLILIDDNKLRCVPLVNAFGGIPSGVRILLLIKASCMNMDSSSTATVKSLGIREIISLAFF
jgi:hypothetical protein